MSHTRILLLVLDLKSKKYPFCAKFEHLDQAKYVSFFTFPSPNTFMKKIAMTTPENNENYHIIQNDSQTCKIKLEKLHLNILWSYHGVIKVDDYSHFVILFFKRSK